MKGPAGHCGVLAWLSLLIAGHAFAASERPAVQVSVEPEVVTVGEPLTLRVSVYAPTWFPEPPVFPDFELPNTITRLPPNSSRPTTIRVEGATWSGIQRRYQIFPLIGGRYRIADRSMRVTYADPGARAPITVDVPIPLVTFEGRVPPGAAELDPYLAGSRLDIDRQILGDTSTLSAGDALVVRYQAALRGMPALFLPPLFQSPDLPGLRAYPDEPELTDADGVATRVEQVTLVFDAGGDYVLPPVSLSWWNTTSDAVEVASVPALTLQVAGPASPPAGVGEDENASHIGPVLLAVAVVALAGLLLRPPLLWYLARRRAARVRYLASEAHAFDVLVKLLRRGDDRRSYGELLTWLERLQPALALDSFARDYGDETLRLEVDKLRSRLWGDGATMPDRDALAQALHNARRGYLASHSAARESALPALNP
jgi:hypothetical protein